MQIEKEWQHHNDAFARQVWDRPWAEVFAVDIGQDFRPNDFEISQPDAFTERRLRQAIHDIRPAMEEIMLDPALAVQAAWNDLHRRVG
jgi:hypothetical protein